MKDNGWVLLHRKLFENPIWTAGTFSKGQAWVDMFANANHQPKSFFVRGNEVKLKRGQLGWSELSMAKRWGWSKGKVRRFLNGLEMEHQIVQQKNHLTSITTLVNYDKYQSNSTADSTADSTTNSTQTKNVKERKEILSPKVDGISAPDPINTLLGAFKKLVNPHINFANKTERIAAKKLIDTYGLENILHNLKIMADLHEKNTPYLPFITTPYEMYVKWPKIINFFKKRGDI